MRRSCLMGLILALLTLVSVSSVSAQQASDGELRIEPPEAVVAFGDKVLFKVFVALPSGERFPAKEVFWRVEPEGIGKIGPEGVFVAGDRPGEGTITAVVSVGERRLREKAKIIVEEREKGVLAGRVVSEVGKGPVPRAEVIAQGMEAPEREIFRAFTDEKGFFEIGVPFGAYRVRARAPGFTPEFFEDAEEPDAAEPVVLSEEARAIRLVFELASEYTISGTVTDASGVPVVRGEVVATQILGDMPGPMSSVGFGLGAGERRGVRIPEDFPQPDELRERLRDWLREPTDELRDRLGDLGLPDPGELRDRLGDLGISDPEEWRERLKERLAEGVKLPPFGMLERFLPIRRVARISEGGVYLLEGLAKGAYIVEVHAPGYLPKVHGQESPGDRPDPVEVPLPEGMTGLDFVLDRGASISGTVTDADGAVLEEARVTAFRLGRERYQQAAVTEADGIYEITGLFPGQYIVRAERPGYKPELYDDAQDRRAATPVEVAANAGIGGINFSLDLAGAIFGVVSASDGTGVPGAMVRVHAVAGFLDRRAPTDETGAYLVDGLPTADYRVWAFAKGFEKSEPQVVRVLDGVHTEFNVTLAVWGSIAGTVSSGGASIAGAEVVARAMDGEAKLHARTDETGAYRIEGVRPGAYIVWVGARGYRGEFHPDATEPDDAEPVKVELSQNVEGIDFDLAKFGSISGVVTAADGGELHDAWVAVTTTRGAEHEFARRVRVEEDGAYLIPDLPPGEYLVRAGAFGYLPTFYTGDTSDAIEPVPVEVALSQDVPGIHVVLPKGGAISGLVLADDTGRPIQGAVVTARPLDEVEGRRAETNELGAYEIVGLRTGRYLVHVEARGFAPEFYDDAPVPDRAEFVEVTAPEATSNITFGLKRRWTLADLGGGIFGRIMDESGRPIPGAIVTALTRSGKIRSVTADREGRYGFDGLEPGVYWVRASGSGYLGRFFGGTSFENARPIRVSEEEKVPVDVALAARQIGPVGIAGTVRNARDRSPLAGALVVLKAGEEIVGTALTGPEGEYRLDRIPPGAYAVEAERPGYERISAPATIQIQSDSEDATDPLAVDLELRPSAARIALVLPNVSAQPGDTVRVPVTVGDSEETGITSSELEIGYDGEVLTSVGISTEGTLAQGWSAESNPVEGAGAPDTLRISMASGTSALSGSGILVWLLFAVSGDAAIGTISALTFERVVFNDGGYEVTAQDGQVRAGAVLGDVSGNGSVTAYDASLILKATVGMLALPDPEYPNLTVEIADVSGNGSIGAYDASLILRYAVGLLDRFPEKESAGKMFAGRRSLRLGPARELAEGRRAIPLLLDRRDGVLSGEIELRFDPAVLRATEVISEYLLVSVLEDDRIRIAFAGTRSDEGPGEIASVIFEPAADLDLSSALHIETARLNEGAFEVDLPSWTPAEPPSRYALSPNSPNPFNPETTIPYEVAEPGMVRLVLYALTGQRIRTLVDAERPAGSYSVVWDGRDDRGRAVASGVYLCRMVAGEYRAVRKMTLLR